MFKKHHWTSYGQRKVKYLDLKVKDSTEQVVDSIRLERGKDIDNDRRLKQIKKYGFDLIQREREKGEKTPEEEIKEESEEEVDWFNDGTKW